MRRIPDTYSKAKKFPLAAGKKKRPLQLGFVPLTDCAPLIMAGELGFFHKHGLKVQLRRELGWATIRDKIIHRELDAAHALAALPFALTFGLGSNACECLTGLVLSLHGNALTLAQTLWNEGVRDGKSLREKIQLSRGQKTFTFGVVFSFSSHHALLRQWLNAAGIDPDRDVRIVVVPPPQMPANLKAGHLDGYCSGEPWNTVAIQQKIGWCAATSAELAPGHPEKVLLVRRSFADERAAEHLALIAALYEACTYCDRPENAAHIIKTLARPEHLNLPAATFEPSLRGLFEFGNGRTEARGDFHLFHHENANEPSPEKAAWVIRTLSQCGMPLDRSVLPASAASRVFRPDIFHSAIALAAQTQSCNAKPNLTHN